MINVIARFPIEPAKWIRGKVAWRLRGEEEEVVGRKNAWDSWRESIIPLNKEKRGKKEKRGVWRKRVTRGNSAIWPVLLSGKREVCLTLRGSGLREPVYNSLNFHQNVAIWRMEGNKVESVYLYLSKIWRENKDGGKEKKKPCVKPRRRRRGKYILRGRAEK